MEISQKKGDKKKADKDRRTGGKPAVVKKSQKSIADLFGKEVAKVQVLEEHAIADV